jgi:hypothetical protein
LQCSLGAMSLKTRCRRHDRGRDGQTARLARVEWTSHCTRLLRCVRMSINPTRADFHRSAGCLSNL